MECRKLTSENSTKIGPICTKVYSSLSRVSRNKKPNYYVVSKGEGLSNNYEHGIFTMWADCSPHVTGVKGTIFQGCKTFDSAKTILETANLAPILVHDNGKWVPIDAFMPEQSGNESDGDIPEFQDCIENNNNTNEPNVETSEQTNPINPDIEITEQTNPKILEVNESEYNGPVVQQITEAQCPLCVNANNDYMLQCSTCKNWLHYVCTQLPKYELAKYIHYKSRRFACQICILKDNKTTSCVENIPVNNYVPSQQRQAQSHKWRISNPSFILKYPNSSHPWIKLNSQL